MEETNDTQETAPVNGQPEAPTTEAKVEAQAEVNWEAKAKELEADAAKWKRIAERNAKKADRKEDVKESDPTRGLDWGQKAYLRSEGVESTDFTFVEEQLQESGLSLDKLLANPYFKSELKARKDQKAAEAALPGNTRAGGDASKSSVEYWVNRGQLPPDTPENRKLRSEIVEERTRRSKSAYQQ